jgi:hypothetical protein
MSSFFNKPARDPDVDYFVATRKVGWIISNSKYENVRKTDPNYKDIDQAVQNAKDIKSFLENSLKFTEIIETLEATAEQL